MTGDMASPGSGFRMAAFMQDRRRGPPHGARLPDVMKTFRSSPRPATGVAARHTRDPTAGDGGRTGGNRRRAGSITRSEAGSEGSALIWKILKNEKYLRIMTGMMFLMYLEFEAGFVARVLRGRHGPLFRDNRRRPRGRHRLDPRQVLVAYLVWMRTGVAQDELGAYLGMDRPAASRYLCIARDVLRYNGLNPSGISRMIRGARTVRDVQKWIPGGVRGAGAVGKGLPDWGRWSRYMRDPGTPDGRRFTVWAGPGYEGLWKILRGADVNSPYKKPGGRACRHGRKGTTGGLRAAGYTWSASWTGSSQTGRCTCRTGGPPRTLTRTPTALPALRTSSWRGGRGA